MYLLGCSDSYHYSREDAVYVLDVIPLALGPAAISSDQSLSLFEPTRLNQGPVRTIRTRHGNLTAAQPYSPMESIVSTAGENKLISLWDLRLKEAAAEVLQLVGAQSGLQSLACSNTTFTIASGTELENGQASVILWDVRQNSSPIREYNDIHSDDVTELKFHPSDPNLLLTGSTDGLVNICDTRIADEDEVVVTAFNHGSVHRAGFLNATEIFAVSHDEKFAIYSMAESDGENAVTLNIGDIREGLSCRYVANIVAKANGAGAVVGSGSQDQQTFQLVHLSKGETWNFDGNSAVGLPGAHGSEIVRGFCFYDGDNVVFTAGEDGTIKAWRPQP